MAIPKLGGKQKTLFCKSDGCNKPRYPHSELCPDCYGKSTDKGTRNTQGNIIQARLPKQLWLAVQFAVTMVREGDKTHHTAVTIASRYYKVDRADVQSAMSQRSALNRKGR